MFGSILVLLYQTVLFLEFKSNGY